MLNFMYKKRTYKCGTGNAEKKISDTDAGTNPGNKRSA